VLYIYDVINVYDVLNIYDMISHMGRYAKHDPEIECKPVNVKLRAELLPKIKMLVGIEMTKEGKYISQQDLLAKFLEERIEAEFASINKNN
jgi:hypothetical protein